MVSQAFLRKSALTVSVSLGTCTCIGKKWLVFNISFFAQGLLGISTVRLGTYVVISAIMRNTRADRFEPKISVKSVKKLYRGKIF